MFGHVDVIEIVSLRLLQHESLQLLNSVVTLASYIRLPHYRMLGLTRFLMVVLSVLFS